MGDDTITAAMRTPIMATVAFRLHTVSTLLCIQNTFAACRSGVADRTSPPNLGLDSEARGSTEPTPHGYWLVSGLQLSLFMACSHGS